MRTHPVCFLSVTLLLCSLTILAQSNEKNIEAEDRAILEEVFNLFGASQDGTTKELILLVAGHFEGSPYVESSLEKEPEQLVVNLREFDCTTFMESCLAISRTIRSGKLNWDQFTFELRNIRYREGLVDGYTSRIHYFSDWIYLSSQKSIVRDISMDAGGSAYAKVINFMSTHPSSYRQLLSNPALVEIIAAQEEAITSRTNHFISQDRLPEVEQALRDGDIVGITTNIKGLDVLHVGIIESKGRSVYLWHASSRLGKVVLSEETLEAYLEKSKSASGIILARPF